MAENKSTDHLILPKKTLMQFMDSKQLVSAIEFSSTEMIKGHLAKHRPRSFHSEPGYYDPSVDKVIKKMETSIGEWRKKIMDYIQSIDSNNRSVNINFTELSNFALNLISLQFNRNVMVDIGLRKSFIDSNIMKLQNEISIISLFEDNDIIRKLKAKLNQLQQFAIDDSNFPKYFQKNYMVHKDRLSRNTLIEEQYNDYIATILVIPDGVNASFLLMPQHYFAVDTVARIVLGPRLAIGLYPPNTINIPDHRVIKVTEDDALSFVARSIESALEMTEDSFKQLIGDESFLNKVENAITLCNGMIENHPITEICSVRVCPQINHNIFSVLIVLLYKYRKKKVLLHTSKELHDRLNTFDWSILIQNYGLKMAIVSSDDIRDSF